MSGEPDFKDAPTVRDGNLLNRLHRRWKSCALCGATWPTTLHHISNKPRDDLEANLVMLCGSGTTGCHGKITANDATKKWELATHIHSKRPDTIAYLNWRFPIEGAAEWTQRVLGA